MGRLEKIIEDLEFSLLEPDIRHSVDELDRLISNDFIEVGSSGRVFNKEQILDVLPKEPRRKFKILDFQVRRLSSDVTQTLFTTMEKVPGGPHVSLRSSIWVRSGQTWQVVFHQGTPREEPA